MSDDHVKMKEEIYGDLGIAGSTAKDRLRKLKEVYAEHKAAEAAAAAQPPKAEPKPPRKMNPRTKENKNRIFKRDLVKEAIEKAADDAGNFTYRGILEAMGKPYCKQFRDQVASTVRTIFEANPVFPYQLVREISGFKTSIPKGPKPVRILEVTAPAVTPDVATNGKACSLDVSPPAVLDTTETMVGRLALLDKFFDGVCKEEVEFIMDYLNARFPRRRRP